MGRVCYIYCDNARLVPNTLGSHVPFSTFIPFKHLPTHFPAKSAFCPPAPFSVLSFLPFFFFRHWADGYNCDAFMIASAHLIH